MFKYHLVPDLIGICKQRHIALIEKGSVVRGNPDTSLNCIRPSLPLKQLNGGHSDNPNYPLSQLIH